MAEHSARVQKIFRSCILFFLAFPALLSTPDLCRGYDRETAVVKVVKKSSPAVVNISSEYEIRTRTNPFSGFGSDPFFDSFFRDFFDRGFERKYKKTSLGSGVIVDGKRGYILTNAHVVANTEAITVILKDEREFSTKPIGMDSESDLAILKIDSDGSLPEVKMGDSSDIMIGETVVAIGNPFGFSHTVTTGVISAVNRSIRAENTVFHDFIQIDAPINPGNSGGPLLNINGELIGINTAIYAKAQGIGFAIPINTARRIMSDLIRYGEVVPAWVGLIVQGVDSRLARYLGFNAKGVIVKAVEEKSPAKKAGIIDGDIVTSVNGKSTRSAEEYDAAIRGAATGSNLKMRVWRDGKTKTVSVKAGEFPIETALDVARDLLGIEVENISRENRHRFRVVAEQGVVIVGIDRRSHLSKIGAETGDVIRQMDEMTVENVEDFKKAIVKCRTKSSVTVLLQRGNRAYYIFVKM